MKVSDLFEDKKMKPIVIKAHTMRATESNGGTEDYTDADCRRLERSLERFGTVLYTVNRTGIDKEIQCVIALKDGLDPDEVHYDLEDKGIYAEKDKDFEFKFDPAKPSAAVKELLNFIKDENERTAKYVIHQLIKMKVKLPEFDAMMKSINATKPSYD